MYGIQLFIDNPNPIFSEANKTETCITNPYTVLHVCHEDRFLNNQQKQNRNTKKKEKKRKKKPPLSFYPSTTCI